MCFFEILKFQYAVFNLGIVVRQRSHVIILIAILFSIIVNLNNREKEIIRQ